MCLALTLRAIVNGKQRVSCGENIILFSFNLLFFSLILLLVLYMAFFIQMDDIRILKYGVQHYVM